MMPHVSSLLSALFAASWLLSTTTIATTTTTTTTAFILPLYPRLTTTSSPPLRGEPKNNKKWFNRVIDPPRVLTSTALARRRRRLSTNFGSGNMTLYSQVRPPREEDEDSKEETNNVLLQPVFDFADRTRQQNETGRFERIDDVIMGGISTSTLRQVDGEPFARWSGVCREDGGGFCGMRTLPFREELDVSDADGMFLTCRLSSDEEPNRRVWKITTRTEKSRGEQLYQAIFTIPQSSSSLLSSSESEEGFSTIRIPFEEFRLVRGARLVPNGEPINRTKGFYQIGLTMSKFTIAENMTSIPNFRPGYFELRIQQIGLYNNNKDDKNHPTTTPTVSSFSKEEALAQRPLLLKVLLPLAVIGFGTEKSQRRKSAMRLLREKRGLTRLGAIRFGLQWRAKQIGIIRSVAKTMSILAVDILRKSIQTFFRYAVFLPLRLLGKTMASIGKLFSKPTKDTVQEKSST